MQTIYVLTEMYDSNKKTYIHTYIQKRGSNSIHSLVYTSCAYDVDGPSLIPLRRAPQGHVSNLVTFSCPRHNPTQHLRHLEYVTCGR